MKPLRIIPFLAIFSFLIACQTSTPPEAPRIRQIKPSEVIGYHDPMNLTIAWFPYEDLILKKSEDHNWLLLKSDSIHESAIPVILITYPGKKDSLWIQMDTENELLGKLIKHSLMTKQPIYEPYSDFFAAASCTKCHPSDILVNFDQ